MGSLVDQDRWGADSVARAALRAWQPRRPQERRRRCLGSSRDVRPWLSDLLRQGWRLDHRAAGRWRQGVASEGRRAGARILARLSGGEKAWQGDMRTGMLGWRRIFGIRSSPASFYSERSRRRFRFRSRLGKLFEQWA